MSIIGSVRTRQFVLVGALGIGQLIGPVAGGAIADQSGTIAIPIFAASAYGLGAILAVADALVARRAVI